MLDSIEIGYHRFSRQRINDMTGADTWLVISVKDGPVYRVAYGGKEAGLLAESRWDYPKMMHRELAKAHDVKVLVFYAVNKPNDERVKALIMSNETSGHQGALMA